MSYPRRIVAVIGRGGGRRYRVSYHLHVGSSLGAQVGRVDGVAFGTRVEVGGLYNATFV